MVGNGMGAKNGILFKTAVSLEEAGKVQIVALDKTGTITSGQPEVTDVLPAPGVDKEELLQYAYTLESRSEHPLARAILTKGKEMDLELLKISDFMARQIIWSRMRTSCWLLLAAFSQQGYCSTPIFTRIF